MRVYAVEGASYGSLSADKASEMGSRTAAEPPSGGVAINPAGQLRVARAINQAQHEAIVGMHRARFEPGPQRSRAARAPLARGCQNRMPADETFKRSSRNRRLMQQPY
jgi:hypothetical protein